MGEGVASGTVLDLFEEVSTAHIQAEMSCRWPGAQEEILPLLLSLRPPHTGAHTEGLLSGDLSCPLQPCDSHVALASLATGEGLMPLSLLRPVPRSLDHSDSSRGGGGHTTQAGVLRWGLWR